MTTLTRRRFLTISAACAACPAKAATDRFAEWRGIAMGAQASMRLNGLDKADAAPIFDAVTAEVARLENIFSLYRPESELCRLNRDGHLSAPSPEMLQLLGLCTALHAASDGAFDPTVQPLWVALAHNADASTREAAWRAIGWHKVSVNATEIRLPSPGLSALTLNGVAQGEVTDRVANLLKSFGLRDVLVNMGEIRAEGQRGDGRPWQVGLAGPEGSVHRQIGLQDRAVATSAPSTMTLSGGHGHILNPTGEGLVHRAISVSAPSAALADGLSTALCALPENMIDPVLSQFPGARLEMQV